jgi:hypothetical protein
MASEGTNAARLLIQGALILAIAGLSWFLYRAIHDPWAAFQAEARETELVRTRMDNVRTALIEFNNRNDRFPGSLDSLVAFVKTDSAIRRADLAELFPRPEWAPPFVADSLPFSPRSGRRFEYVVNDTSDLDIYYLADPDNPADHIGAREPDPGRRNAASWE